MTHFAWTILRHFREFPIYFKGFESFLAEIEHFQLRYLQTLNNISAENNSTIVFPVPIDILSQVFKHSHHHSQQGNGSPPAAATQPS